MVTPFLLYVFWAAFVRLVARRVRGKDIPHLLATLFPFASWVFLAVKRRPFVNLIVARLRAWVFAVPPQVRAVVAMVLVTRLSLFILDAGAVANKVYNVLL